MANTFRGRRPVALKLRLPSRIMASNLVSIMTTEGSQLVKILEELRSRISTILLDELDIVETEMKTWKKYQSTDINRLANYQRKIQDLKTEMADKTEKYHALKRILALQEILPHL